MDMDVNNNHVTVKQMANILGISTHAVYMHVKDKKIPTITKDKVLMVDPEDFDDYIKGMSYDKSKYASLKDVAKRMNLPTTVVYNYMKRHKDKLPSLKMAYNLKDRGASLVYPVGIVEELLGLRKQDKLLKYKVEAPGAVNIGTDAYCEGDLANVSYLAVENNVSPSVIKRIARENNIPFSKLKGHHAVRRFYNRKVIKDHVLAYLKSHKTLLKFRGRFHNEETVVYDRNTPLNPVVKPLVRSFKTKAPIKNDPEATNLMIYLGVNPTKDLLLKTIEAFSKDAGDKPLNRAKAIILLINKYNSMK